MNEFINLVSGQNVSVPLLVFLMIFSCGIALFHTLIFGGLYNLTIRPKWLFFALNPISIALAFLYRPGYSIFMLAILFASVFIFAIIGMIYSSIKGAKTEKENAKKFAAKYNMPKTEKVKQLAVTFGFLAFIAVGFWLYSIEKLSLLLVIIPVLVALDAIFLPSKKTKFYKLQTVLPTSKMNAVAMGLVEVVGDLVQTEPIISPHFKTPCIGYKIRIEQEGKDSDGKRTWSTIFRETKTGTFKIKDDTGAVFVNGEGLEYYIERVDREEERGDKRYSETYLRHDDYIFLIGKAASKGGETIVEKDDYHKVFGVAFPHEVALRNKFAPLYKSFSVTLFFITLIIIYIIIS